MPVLLYSPRYRVFITSPKSLHSFLLSRIPRALIVSDNLPLHTDFSSTTQQTKTKKPKTNE